MSDSNAVFDHMRGLVLSFMHGYFFNFEDTVLKTHRLSRRFVDHLRQSDIFHDTTHTGCFV